MWEKSRQWKEIFLLFNAAKIHEGDMDHEEKFSAL